jgi:TetR/AcrR family transcriptional repressor of lmrAB and yxaGH operons
MTTARDQLISSTCDLLELQGYHATGLNQILRESSSPKGSLYYYFPGGKEELTAKALEHVGSIVLERMKVNLALTDDPADAIGQFIRNIAVNVEASGYQAGGPITTVALETAATSEALREVCFRIYSSWIGAMREKLMSVGCEPGRADALAQVIISAIEGAIILSRSGRSTQPLLNVANEVEVLLRAAR